MSEQTDQTVKLIQDDIRYHSLLLSRRIHEIARDCEDFLMVYESRPDDATFPHSSFGSNAMEIIQLSHAIYEERKLICKLRDRD